VTTRAARCDRAGIQRTGCLLFSSRVIPGKKICAMETIRARSFTPISPTTSVRPDYIEAARARIAAERKAGATYFIYDLGRYTSERDSPRKRSLHVEGRAKRAGARGEEVG
jgi:hypothetical protein